MISSLVSIPGSRQNHLSHDYWNWPLWFQSYPPEYILPTRSTTPFWNTNLIILFHCLMGIKGSSTCMGQRTKSSRMAPSSRNKMQVTCAILNFLGDTCATGEEGEKRELLFNEYRASVWKDKKVLHVEGHDGCTTMWICLMLLYTVELHT